MGASLESSFGAAIGVLEDVPASVNTNLISHPVINHVKIPLIIIIYFWRGLMNKMLSVVCVSVQSLIFTNSEVSS